MEIDSMTSLLRAITAAPIIIVIARMLGKAVKFRHCPATVSALFPLPSYIEALVQTGFSRCFRYPRSPLEATGVESIRVRFWEGG
jgi:hypothetical protein